MTAAANTFLNAPVHKTTYEAPGVAAGVVSTSSYAEVVGSKMDLSGTTQFVPWYQVKETGGSHDVKAKVQMSVDGMTWFDASSTSFVTDGTATTAFEQTVSAGTSVLIYVPMSARMVRLVIEDASNGSHGTVTVNGYGH